MCLDIGWVWPYQEFRVVLQQEGPPWSNGNSESHSHKLLDTTTITITINIIISSEQMIVSGRPCFDVSIGFWLSSGLMKSSSAFEHPIGRALMVHGRFWHSVIEFKSLHFTSRPLTFVLVENGRLVWFSRPQLLAAWIIQPSFSSSFHPPPWQSRCGRLSQLLCQIGCGLIRLLKATETTQSLMYHAH